MDFLSPRLVRCRMGFFPSLAALHSWPSSSEHDGSGGISSAGGGGEGGGGEFGNAGERNRVEAIMALAELGRSLDSYVDSDSHCTVCTDAFTLRSEALELPCKHIHHPDCVSHWPNLHKSCPVCRHELPSDEIDGDSDQSESVGLSIWRLPGGGFAVGSFVGHDGEMPTVYSELDGIIRLNDGISRGIEWGPWVRRRRVLSGGFSIILVRFSNGGGWIIWVQIWLGARVFWI